jgi:hypothetical protein
MSRTRSAAILSTFQATTLFLTAFGAVAADGFAITSVNLSSGGLAEIVGSEKVNGSGRIGLEVPIDQVDDILKSLVVLDPHGTVSGVTLNGPSATQEAFKRVPFTADDLGDIARFANALQGVRVSISRPLDTPIEGEVLGVVTTGGKDGEITRMLSLLSDGSVRTLSLTDGVTLKILDPVMRQKVEEAVSAVRKSKTDGARSVSIGVSGSASREVSLSYVVPSAVWKTSFRLISDGSSEKSRIQGWAVVENTTGAPWKDVVLSLTSGAPVALKQRLHEHYWKNRKEIPIGDAIAEAPQPAPYAVRRTLAAQEKTITSPRIAPQAAGIAMMAAPAMADMSAPEERIEANQGDVNVSYKIPTPITLSAGETMSVPIIDTEIKSERVSLYRFGGGAHPQAAIRFTNTSGSTLPPGIMTIYDRKDGYAGDATIPALRAGGTNLLAFATDNKVDISGLEKPPTTRTRVSIADGILKSETVSAIEREYRIKGAPDSDRVVMLEHPERSGWTTKTDADQQRIGNTNYLSKKVAASRDILVKVTDEMTSSTSTRILDTDETSLRQWSAAAVDSGVSEKISRVIAAKSALEAAKRDLQVIDITSKRFADEQARIRENLKAVPEKSDASVTYTKKLIEAEDAITRSEATREKAKDSVDQKESALRSLIRGL